MTQTYVKGEVAYPSHANWRKTEAQLLARNHFIGIPVVCEAYRAKGPLLEIKYTHSTCSAHAVRSLAI